MEVMRKSFTDGMARLREQANYKETQVGGLLDGTDHGASE